MTDRIRETVHVIDSHTEGEPTRTVISGGPNLCGGSIAEKLSVFRESYDGFRSGVVCEPRGSDVLVGALLVAPSDPSCAAGVIFFNNVGYLGMCGHGTIGLVATLAHLGVIVPGRHRIETPVGIVTATLHHSGKVSVENVPSYRWVKQAPVSVDGYGVVRGDVAWGGNWFFLVNDHGQDLTLANAKTLTDFTVKIQKALAAQSVTGRDGREIDHVELFAPSETAGSRNFVLCPGEAYDRSPCGTGTSAKLACLYADGKLAEGEVWRQEGILGTAFEGTVAVQGEEIIPTISGRAYITADTQLVFDPADPFREGIR
ncbi:4-hydroxyproline 2-epimerase [Capsulimonas corticalis]|uniref:4-hydroxyproline 2-epimerase n=1 Tax=Capsulimonas corticalis TaxID=2219043 RepID=A0A402D6I2_9BACT|nr:proline racemase family protein [Capsulimonas corticalis]BDI32449.1 4-hydroxyproline 2-epimerase [Capsulimonas corticalis]